MKSVHNEHNNDPIFRIEVFESYLDVVKRFMSQHALEKGYQGRLAEASGCHKSYFSRVLKDQKILSLEQAASLADFWELDSKQSIYFILLVLTHRAGTPRLKVKVDELLRQLRDTMANA